MFFFFIVNLNEILNRRRLNYICLGDIVILFNLSLLRRTRNIHKKGQHTITKKNHKSGPEKMRTG